MTFSFIVMMTIGLWFLLTLVDYGMVLLMIVVVGGLLWTIERRPKQPPDHTDGFQ